VSDVIRLPRGTRRRAALADLYARYVALSRRELSTLSDRFVPGEGSVFPRAMLIGEAPGEQEDRQQRPFCGPSGELLDELLASVRLSRDLVWVTNVVKYRPPRNRTPSAAETAANRWLVIAELRLLQPFIVAPMGAVATSLFFPNHKVSRIAGELRMWQNYPTVPLLHPAAALHNPTIRAELFTHFACVGHALTRTSI
jgi:uracil-DNA glycosylase family 4